MSQMANMKNTVFRHLFPTKAEEEELLRLNVCVPSPEEQSEVVQIRDDTPQLLDLFPREMTKVLNQSDLANFPGLKLNRQLVLEHLCFSVLTDAPESLGSSRAVQMANMKNTVFRHLFPTKAEEEEFLRLNVCVPSPEEQSEVVQIRDDTPQLLDLFPREMTEVLNQSDLANFPGLKLNRQLVREHLCFSVLKDAPESLGSSRAVQGGTSGSSEAGRLNLELSLK